MIINWLRWIGLGRSGLWALVGGCGTITNGKWYDHNHCEPYQWWWGQTLPPLIPIHGIHPQRVSGMTIIPSTDWLTDWLLDHWVSNPSTWPWMAHGARGTDTHAFENWNSLPWMASEEEAKVRSLIVGTHIPYTYYKSCMIGGWGPLSGWMKPARFDDPSLRVGMRIKLLEDSWDFLDFFRNFWEFVLVHLTSRVKIQWQTHKNQGWHTINRIHQLHDLGVLLCDGKELNSLSYRA